jgi:hypothetical protein
MKIREIDQARVWFDNIEVTRIEVVKETAKQLNLIDDSRVNKDCINKPNRVGECYGYTLEQAINNLMTKLRYDIERTEEQLKREKERLNLPIKYI